ncbi:uncharacterized protein B0I36DRAFT_100348 [Microdochium trichocladiopsis]|uniref:Zn(2)-C6 fungal-type domain-containing protein n=1 Tax=Microdochium trichocladiopsis TaxID=1682393 RepID=A0A9P8Y862_9PEZI|nr:uncharacterized protein B0I36DRAFT_100348 [Microdochium trichocladiopsis]KAH7032763.1 hypothetical protein B0I36DRAFT_100348 [Microdochium trichocladiopsis]
MDAAQHQRERDPAGSSRQSAPYGHACAGCVRAKCKCVVRSHGGTDPRCERCCRLDRECVPSPNVRSQAGKRNHEAGKRRAVKSNANAGGISGRHGNLSSPAEDRIDRTTQLEQKLDSLMDMLASQCQQRLSPAATAGAFTPPLSVLTRAPDDVQGQVPISTSSSVQQSQDAGYLSQFRSFFLQACPFIYLAPETTVAELQQKRPFLWLNIKSVCCKSTREQIALDHEIRAILAQKIIVEMERNLDLLQGLLVFLTWTVRRFRDKPFLCVYSGIAASMVSDLRLDRLMHEPVNRETNSSHAFAQPFHVRPQLPHLERTNEERRTVLGCYIHCASLHLFLRSPPMRWTSHMDECLQHLADKPEVPADAVLVTIVKLNRVLENLVPATAWRFDLEEPDQSELPSPMLYVRSMISNLKAIRDESRAKTPGNRYLQAYLAHAEVLVNDLPLHSIFAPRSRGTKMDMDRISCLHACLQGMRSFFDSMFTLTPEEFFGSPSFLGIGYTRVLHILYRLSCTEDPSWDRSMIRETIDVIKELEAGADLFAAIPAALGLELVENDTFSRTAPMLRACSLLWQRNLMAAEGNGDLCSAHRTLHRTQQRWSPAEHAGGQTCSTSDSTSRRDVEVDITPVVGPEQPISNQSLHDDTMFADLLNEDWQMDSSMMWFFNGFPT